MFSKICVFVFCLTLPILCSAQFNSYSEGGMIAAFTNYSGDIAENRVEIGETKVGFGAFIRHTFSEKLAAKGQVYIGQISGDDINSSQKADRKYQFFASIVEVSTVAEFSFFNNAHGGYGTGVHGTPFFFAGLGLSYAKPEAKYYGNVPNQNPFPEADQQNIFVSLPIGIGGKLYLDQHLSASAEFGWRPVFSDKLDGVSVNGNPNKKDWYVVMGMGISYVFSQ